MNFAQGKAHERRDSECARAHHGGEHRARGKLTLIGFRKQTAKRLFKRANRPPHVHDRVRHALRVAKQQIERKARRRSDQYFHIKAPDNQFSLRKLTRRKSSSVLSLRQFDASSS